MSEIMDATRQNAENVAEDFFDSMFSAPALEMSLPEPVGYRPDDLPGWDEGVETGKERLYPKASWLDAMTSAEDDDGKGAELHRISQVNSDENGLYRMFVGVSP